MKKRRLLGVIFWGVALAVPAVAQDPEPAPKPCSAPEHRQFDFWLGEWTARRHWERSIDHGKTWKTVFDGLYSKAK